jgi:hypothetical protein
LAKQKPVHFTIEVKDYCWVTRIIEDPDSKFRLYSYQQRTKTQVVMPFAPFTDTVTYDITHGQKVYSYETFPVNYTCRDYSYHA